MKRQKFYVNSMIWGQGLGPAPIALYTYLSRCADAEGRCFPSVPDIAEQIGVSVSTAKRALKTLCDKGLVIKEPRFHETAHGRRRVGSNVYTLVSSICTGVKSATHNDPHPGSQGTPQGVMVNGHINNNIINNRGLSPSLSYKEPNGGKRKIGDEDLEKLLEDLNPHIYDDEHYGNALEAAIREMWNAAGMKINGNYVKQVEVRKRLALLNIDCLDEVYRALADAREVENKTQFLKVCLYNAPLRCGVQIASQIAGRVFY